MDDQQELMWEKRSFDADGSEWTGQLFLAQPSGFWLSGHSLAVINDHFSLAAHASNGQLRFITYY